MPFDCLSDGVCGSLFVFIYLHLRIFMTKAQYELMGLDVLSETLSLTCLHVAYSSNNMCIIK